MVTFGSACSVGGMTKDPPGPKPSDFRSRALPPVTQLLCSGLIVWLAIGFSMGIHRDNVKCVIWLSFWDSRASAAKLGR